MKFRRAAASFVACLVPLLSALPSHAASAYSYGRRTKRSRANKQGLSFLTGASYSYDDNVHGLSPKDIDALNSLGTRNAFDTAFNRVKYDRMASVGDSVYQYKAGVFGQYPLFGKGYGSRLGIEGKYHQYALNSIKNYPTTDFSVRQYFTERHYLQVDFIQDSHKFVRNYVGSDTPLRYAALHRTREWDLSWDGHFKALRHFGFGAKAGYIQDSFEEAQLRYRNSVAHKYEGHVSYKWSKSLKTTLVYRYETALDVREQIPDVFALTQDGSFREHMVGLKAAIKPIRRLEIDLNYAAHTRTFTATLGSVADPFHSGRRDFKYQAGLKASYAFFKKWKLWGGYERTENTTNLKQYRGAFLPDDTLRHRANVFSVGVEARFL